MLFRSEKFDTKPNTPKESISISSSTTELPVNSIDTTPGLPVTTPEPSVIETPIVTQEIIETPVEVINETPEAITETPVEVINETPIEIIETQEELPVSKPKRKGPQRDASGKFIKKSSSAAEAFTKKIEDDGIDELFDKLLEN